MSSKKSLIYDISKFSAVIAKRRDELKLTQKGLAQAVFRDELNTPNADASTLESKRKIINGYENSKSPKYPSNPETYCRLCEELDCDLDYLFGAISTPHRETTDIIEETGLSEKAVNRLAFIRDSDHDLMNLINELILDPGFMSALQDLQKAREIKKQCDIKDSYRKVIEEIYNLSPKSYDVDSAKDLIHEYEAYADAEIQKESFGTITNMSSRTMSQMYYMASKESMGQAFFRLFNKTSKK